MESDLFFAQYDYSELSPKVKCIFVPLVLELVLNIIGWTMLSWLYDVMRPEHNIGFTDRLTYAVISLP